MLVWILCLFAGICFEALFASELHKNDKSPQKHPQSHLYICVNTCLRGYDHAHVTQSHLI